MSYFGKWHGSYFGSWFGSTLGVVIKKYAKQVYIAMQRLEAVVTTTIKEVFLTIKK